MHLYSVRLYYIMQRNVFVLFQPVLRILTLLTPIHDLSATIFIKGKKSVLLSLKH